MGLVPPVESRLKWDLRAEQTADLDLPDVFVQGKYKNLYYYSQDGP